MELDLLTAISPIDGRYRGKTDALAAYFSEFALIKYRVQVEVEYFTTLCELPLPQLRGVNKDVFETLRNIYRNFSEADAGRIKDIESVTNHDVKAVEYFLKEEFDKLGGMDDYKEFILKAETSNEMAGMVNWNYALHYQFRLTENLKILAGPMLDLNGGFIYNMRNSNNPAQAKAYVNLAASGMVIYRFHIGNYPLIARYQANLPVMGIMFSPEYGQSYYEIFSLKNGGKNVLFTSLHNQPSLRQLVTLDFPIRSVNMRFGYLCDIQQAKVNNLKSHIWSHAFMIGFVKNFYLLKGKNKVAMPSRVSPY